MYSRTFVMVEFWFGFIAKIMTTIYLYDNDESFAMTGVTFIYYSSNQLGREYVYASIP